MLQETAGLIEKRLSCITVAHVSQCVIQHGLTAQVHPARVCTEISSTIICSQDFETYHCKSDTNQNSEVHVLASHQAISCCSDFPESSRIEVVNEGQRGRKVVLVLASTRPVNWFLDMEYGTEIDTVVLVRNGKRQGCPLLLYFH